LISSMIHFRDILSENPSTREKLYKQVKLWDEKEVELWDKKEDIIGKFQMISNIQDFLIISDLYEELNKRNLYMQNLSKDKQNGDVQNKKDIEERVREYNQTCLSAVEKALKGIDWNKYDVGYFKLSD
jgi:hypothetical protein